MKKITSAILFSIITAACFGQITAQDYCNLADSMQKNNEFYKSVVYYTNAIELSSENSQIKIESYVFRGYCKSELGDYRGAIDDYSTAIPMKITSGDMMPYQFNRRTMEIRASCYYLRGLSYYNLHDLEKACRDFSKAGELGEKDAYDEIRKYCN